MTDSYAGEARKLSEAGWERRGEGPKAIWRRPEGGRWWAHYQALIELRRDRLAGDGPNEEEGA